MRVYIAQRETSHLMGRIYEDPQPNSEAQTF